MNKDTKLLIVAILMLLLLIFMFSWYIINEQKRLDIAKDYCNKQDMEFYERSYNGFTCIDKNNDLKYFSYDKIEKEVTNGKAK